MSFMLTDLFLFSEDYLYTFLSIVRYYSSVYNIMVMLWSMVTSSYITACPEHYLCGWTTAADYMKR